MALQITQDLLLSKPNVGFTQSLNTAISFVTNTNWQNYNPEATLENFVQTLGLSVQMFLSAGTGLAVPLVVTRAFIDYPASKINIKRYIRPLAEPRILVPGQGEICERPDFT